MPRFLESDASAVEREAGFEVLLALFAVGLRELGGLEMFEIAESTLEGAFSGGAVTLHVGEGVERGGGPEGGVGLGFVEGVLGGVLGADAAPQEPLGVSEVFDQGARRGSFGVEFGEEAGEEISEVFLALAGDDEFLGSAAVGGGVIGRMGFSCRGG